VATVFNFGKVDLYRGVNFKLYREYLDYITDNISTRVDDYKFHLSNLVYYKASFLEDGENLKCGAFIYASKNSKYIIVDVIYYTRYKYRLLRKKFLKLEASEEYETLLKLVIDPDNIYPKVSMEDFIYLYYSSEYGIRDNPPPIVEEHLQQF
jgi:hypothetical protein